MGGLSFLGVSTFSLYVCLTFCALQTYLFSFHQPSLFYPSLLWFCAGFLFLIYNQSYGMLPTIFLKKYKYILFCLIYSSLLLKHEVKALCKNMNTEWNDCHFWISGEPHTDSCYCWCQSHLHVIKHFSILSHCTSMINTLLQAFTYILVLP